MFDASQNLYHLEHINISNTTISDVTSFGNLRGQLKTLLAYNAPVTWTEPAEFKNLHQYRSLTFQETLMMYQVMIGQKRL